jgi:hypothetical protein
MVEAAMSGAVAGTMIMHHRKILRHIDSYVAYVEIGHLAVCASARIAAIIASKPLDLP